MKPYYQSDRVTLYHGDALAVLASLPDGSVDAVVTDPPYSSGGMVRGDRNPATSSKYQHGDTKTKGHEFQGDTRDQRAWLSWCGLWMSESRRAVVPSGVLAAFTDWRQLPTTTDAVQIGGWVWRGIAVWDKGNAIPQPNAFRAQCEYVVWATNGPRTADYADGKYQPGLWAEASPRERCHITQKPVGVMGWLCGISPDSSTILDPFTGSGTTAIACLNTGRKFIGCEIDERYCEIAAKRIQKAERERAELLTPEATR